jgi:hypothetical protein
MTWKLAPLLVALTLGGAACATASDDALLVESSAEPLALLRAAPDAAAEAGSSRVDLEMVMDVPGMDRPATITGTGAMDEATGKMQMSIDMSEVVEAIAATEGGPMPDGIDEPMEMVVDQGTVYMRVPMLADLLGTSRWIRVTPQDMGLDLGSFGLGGGGVQDPGQMLEALRGVSDDVERVGEEEVRGVDTVRYHATLDLGRAIAELPASQREALADGLEDLSATFGDLPVDVWVDAEGLVRRMEMVMDASEALDDGRMTMRFELYDYGEPVEITVPPAEDVIDFGEVMDQMGDATLWSEEAA